MRLWLFAAAPIFLTGCGFDTSPAGPLQSETKIIERDNAELVKVDLKMGAGELRVQGGAAKLMEAEFSYNVPSWKPDVRYSNTGVRGYLTVEQPSTSKVAGQNRYIWDLKLSDEVPLDLTVHFGAGEAKLNLGSLSLRSVEMDMGVGEIKVDLRGQPKRDYDVHIRGGVGEATVYLPRDAGVYADASGGIGGIKATGLRKQGSHYVNDAYETSKVKIHLDIRGGIGAINLIGS
jgi:hypothetical protein